jgi:N utilization substance protein A
LTSFAAKRSTSSSTANPPRSTSFTVAALAPATVNDVILTGERSCEVHVDADQLSLAIGKEGQNARLAARLTGFKIDIKAE